MTKELMEEFELAALRNFNVVTHKLTEEKTRENYLHKREEISLIIKAFNYVKRYCVVKHNYVKDDLPEWVKEMLKYE